MDNKKERMTPDKKKIEFLEMTINNVMYNEKVLYAELEILRNTHKDELKLAKEQGRKDALEKVRLDKDINKEHLKWIVRQKTIRGILADCKKHDEEYNLGQTDDYFSGYNERSRRMIEYLEQKLKEDD